MRTQRAAPPATSRNDIFYAVVQKEVAHHGSPRLCVNTVPPGAGNWADPFSVAATRSRPILQHGHKPTSIFATRLKKACADSIACGLLVGICKARRAALSFFVLQLEANTP